MVGGELHAPAQLVAIWEDQGPRAVPAWVLQRRERVGDSIRRVRHDRNLTQERLAEQCGLDRKTISRIENAVMDPLLGHLLLIADALDLPLTVLVTE
ncbi:helix-turn-helix transcriptional regulator [Streptomyces sp. NPDC004647]|uniref:helix-turn-helix transcriptional regulator n=1 Tax=Streptomyces sp. NPDC004647 TaxID=3154671 RepID=UPI0033A64D80